MAHLNLRITRHNLEALRQRNETHFWLVQPYFWFIAGLGWLKYRLLFCALSRPGWLGFTRQMLRIARWFHPVPRAAGHALPLNARDLREALARTQDFNGAEDMSPRLPAGENVLAIDWPQRHGEERARLERVLAVDWANRYGDAPTDPHERYESRPTVSTPRLDRAFSRRLFREMGKQQIDDEPLGWRRRRALVKFGGRLGIETFEARLIIRAVEYGAMTDQRIARSVFDAG